MVGKKETAAQCRMNMAVQNKLCCFNVTKILGMESASAISVMFAILPSKHLSSATRMLSWPSESQVDTSSARVFSVNEPGVISRAFSMMAMTSDWETVEMGLTSFGDDRIRGAIDLGVTQDHAELFFEFNRAGGGKFAQQREMCFEIGG